MDHQRPREQGLVHLRGDPFALSSQGDQILQAVPSPHRLPRQKEEERGRVKYISQHQQEK